MIQEMTPRGGAREGAGRKAQGDEPLNQPVRLMLTKTDKEHLEAARKRKETISEAARRLILEGLKRLRRKK